MDAVLRALVVYAALLVIFRVMGKRSLTQVTTFDLVLVLIVGEASQQVLLGEDFSLTMALVVILTLIALDRVANYVGFRFPVVDKYLESVSILLVDDGEVLHRRLRKEHVSVDEILTAARRAHGVETMDQVKYAVLEKDGGITVVPRQGA